MKFSVPGLNRAGNFVMALGLVSLQPRRGGRRSPFSRGPLPGLASKEKSHSGWPPLSVVVVRPDDVMNRPSSPLTRHPGAGLEEKTCCSTTRWFRFAVICFVVFPGQLRPRLAYRGGIVHCVTHRPTAAPVCSSLSSLRLLPSGSRQAAHSCVAAAPPLSLGADVPSDLCSGLRQHNRAVCELGQPRRSVRRPNQVGSPSN